ncbi:hypothetical protein BU16DRAFT_526391 [Lophium mytilinum]|uniref:Uncharacterized protein n=1 Tax=Lophium mytilinum TaxID=390894 RepID=A0A6A6QUH6_9PEZI|nr:hypothetical protein BU16DRAFT_526391 [Lophium mytilinum]
MGRTKLGNRVRKVAEPPKKKTHKKSSRLATMAEQQVNQAMAVRPTNKPEASPSLVGKTSSIIQSTASQIVKGPEKSTVQLNDGTSEPKTGFMSLSGELRNIIYRLALVSKNPLLVYLDIGPDLERKETFEDPPALLYRWGITKTRKGHPSIPRPKPKLLSNAPTVALLQVSRQINREAKSIYYGENLFTLHNDFSKYYMNSDLEENRWVKRFQEWQTDLGDSLQWIKRLHICTYRFSGPELVPYVMFAIEHPDISIEVSNIQGACFRCENSGEELDEHAELVPLAEKLAILKDPGWIEELRAGNIEDMRLWRYHDPPTRAAPFAHYTINTRKWQYRVDKVSYGLEASRRIKGARAWQELCDKLSQSYEFVLEPLKARKGPRYTIHVAPRLQSEDDMDID